MLSKNIFGALLGAWLGHKFDKGLSFDFDALNQKNEVALSLFFHKQK